jgi:hypothetical protein
MCIQGNIFGGCNSNIPVDSLVSALLLFLSMWHIRYSTCYLVSLKSIPTWLRSLCHHDLLLWIGEKDDNEEIWEILGNI